jgi:hypothetical protein
MFKKVLLPLSIVAVLSAGFVSVSSFQKPKAVTSTSVKQPVKMPVINSEGDYKTYSTIESMQQEADLVVVASPIKPFDQRNHVTTYVDGPNGEKYPENVFTLTDIKIKKILAAKDESFKKLKNASVIEEVGIFKDNDEINKKLLFEGYEEMNEKQDYILYLKKNDKGYYNIVNIKQMPLQQEHASDHAQFEQQVKTKFKKELAEYTN